MCQFSICSSFIFPVLFIMKKMATQTVCCKASAPCVCICGAIHHELMGFVLHCGITRLLKVGLRIIHSPQVCLDMFSLIVFLCVFDCSVFAPSEAESITAHSCTQK